MGDGAYFLRVQGFEPGLRRGQYLPLRAGHPAVGELCAVCGEPLRVGDVATLINPRPTNAQDADCAERGGAYTAKVDIAHDRCVFEPTPGKLA